MQCVGLLGTKAWIRIPGQSSKVKYEKFFFGDFLLADFWQKLPGKSFSKNLSFGVDVKLGPTVTHV